MREQFCKIGVKNPTPGEICRVINRGRSSGGVILTLQKDLVTDAIHRRHYYSPQSLHKFDRVKQIYYESSCQDGRFTEIVLLKNSEKPQDTIPFF